MTPSPFHGNPFIMLVHFGPFHDMRMGMVECVLKRMHKTALKRQQENEQGVNAWHKIYIVKERVLSIKNYDVPGVFGAQLCLSSMFGRLSPTI